MLAGDERAAGDGGARFGSVYLGWREDLTGAGSCESRESARTSRGTRGGVTSGYGNKRRDTEGTSL
eukprot:scaffold31243_cov107-Isochrysis_galbana.AAC.2